MKNAQSEDEESQGRVLVVDDNPDNRELLARRLSRRGYDVQTVGSGSAALHEVARESFDAVLLDIEMPDMSGLQVLAQIRARFSKTELPVVMATARTESEDMVEAFRLGANDYVTKPLDFPVVVARLQAQLAVRRELKAASRPPLLLPPTDDVPPGTVIDGRYRVDQEIGGGGFAVVYAGIQLATGLPVAIKLLRSHRLLLVDAATELARFELEMRVIAQIAHPAIVRLVDSGTLIVRSLHSNLPIEDQALAETRPSLSPKRAEGSQPPSPAPSDLQEREHRIPYIVMERLLGETLAESLAASGPMQACDAVDTLLPILDGMHVAHEQGIVHRDVKPSNIMLCRSSSGPCEPKIVDFGIAKLTGDDRPDLTGTASVIGTPTYMSPEQATASELDGRCDQYALANVLFECLVGKPLCDASASVAVLQQIASGEHVKRRLAEASVPREIKPVLARALALDPEDRFATLRAFGDALLPFASEAGAASFRRLRAEPPSGVKPLV